MNWRVKGLIQKVLGYLPAGDQAHYLLQRHFGAFKDFAGEFKVKVDDWRLMVGHLAGAGRPIAGARLFEVGTGWYPTFPFACYLGGAARVVTFDLNRHMKVEFTRGCASLLGEHLDLIASTCGVPVDEVRERHRGLVDRLDDRLDLGAATGGVVEYRAPADARDTGLPDGQLDCVFSNSVLEHIPGDAIEGIFRESRRILAPGGIMFHSANCGDHYAYVDRSISQLHYLQYSDRAWSLWQNRFLYQNRLRAHEFVDMAVRAGFEITLNTAHPQERRLRELGEVRVDPQFDRFPPEQLCITSIDFIGRNPAAAAAAS
jgi:SAM-dependent methyltransferase